MYKTTMINNPILIDKVPIGENISIRVKKYKFG
jgi:hypothetical protein